MIDIMIVTIFTTVALVVFYYTVSIALTRARLKKNCLRAKKYFKIREKEMRKAERTACEEIMNNSFRTMVSVTILLTMVVVITNITTQFHYSDVVELENTVKAFNNSFTIYSLARAEYYKLGREA